MTTIEWTRNADGTAGETWNPTTGCDRTSPGCDNCYALTLARRLRAMGQPEYQRDGDPLTSGPGFGLTLHPDVLDVPLRRKKPTTWFVNSMSDLFHREVPDEFIANVFATMAAAERHTFQILTKRPQRMPTLLGRPSFETLALDWGRATMRAKDPTPRLIEQTWPLPNVWLGTSIESDRYAFRADHLRATPAAVRFLSLEPLLGPLPSLDLTGVDWVIAGGESGPHARPCHPDWARDVRDRCVAAGIPFFWKQWGEWAPWAPEDWSEGAGGSTAVDPLGNVGWAGGCSDYATNASTNLTEGWIPVTRAGKKAAGRLLDGEQWNQMPERKGAAA